MHLPKYDKSQAEEELLQFKNRKLDCEQVK